jgi:wyosine [tRNA(Phe)-imidazoG37] synthetase (radical SAM superfamily)
MSTFLFDDIVFGPVNSRRFGVSLGINLLPAGYKFCTFNCIYCECGWTFREQSKKHPLPKRIEIYQQLNRVLEKMKIDNNIPDNITFAGNGEPTIHPQFAAIIDDTIELRNKYFPELSISVLSNSTMLHKKDVFNALHKIENNVLKLDTAIEETFRILNQPYAKTALRTIIENIKRFNGNQVIQTLFIRGKFNGRIIDNTTDDEVNAWLEVLNEIKPKYVMIYPIARDTPVKGLEKITRSELDSIANRVEGIGIPTKTYD